MNKRVILLTGIIFCGAVAMSGCKEEENMADEAKTTFVADEEGIDKATGEEATLEATTENPTSPTGEETETPTILQEAVYEDFEGYRIKKVNLNMKTVARMNIRRGPHESYERVGGLDINEEIRVTGHCEVTGWYKIEHEGIVGYVSGEYLTLVEEETYKLVLGEECPYAMLVKTTYNGQIGWFYRAAGEDKPAGYEKLIREIMEKDGYTVKNEPIYIGTWRDVGDIMWVGYSK